MRSKQLRTHKIESRPVYEPWWQYERQKGNNNVYYTQVIIHNFTNARNNLIIT